MSQHREGGWTIAEAMAALALLSVGITMSLGIFFRAKDVDRGVAAAETRVALAERWMERTLALSWSEMASGSWAVLPAEADGRAGFRVEVRVNPASGKLRAIEVVVRGAGGTTRIETLATRWRAGA